jgi:DNA-directed RNA polymerase subunit RPC12/RpoP
MSDALFRVTDSDALFTKPIPIASHEPTYGKTRHYPSPVTNQGNRSTSKLVAIVCALCRTKLADAIPGSIARCPNCGTWSGTVERPRLPRRQIPWDQKRGVL